MKADTLEQKYPPVVLVVDDVPNNLSMISEMLIGLFRCRVAISGQKALAIAKSEAQPDVILLDINMPEMDGYAVCRELKKDPHTADIPVIFLTALDSDEDEAKGFAVGGVDYITKPVSRSILVARLNAQLIITRSRRFLARRNDVLEEMVNERSQQLASMQGVVIMAMASLAESRDSDTGAHIRRVQHFSAELARALRKNKLYAAMLSDEVIELLFKTCPLHDIGKVGVPDSILFKPDRLSSPEYEEMKRHSSFGGQTLLEVEKTLAAPEAFVTMAHEIAMHHHERWDGSGYPLGLRGEEIPLSARIVALADTYDALVSRRVYKPAYSPDDTAAIILSERGRQFDPAVVEAFLECEEAFRYISRMFADMEGGGPSRAFTHFIGE